MDALLAFALPLAQEAAEAPADEGKKIIIAMLIVGGVFLAVILFGELAERLRHRRKRTRSVY